MRFAPALRFFTRRNTDTPHAQDPADMGTAFGMEASLEAGEGMYQQHTAEVELESQRAQRALESPLAWLSKRN